MDAPEGNDTAVPSVSNPLATEAQQEKEAPSVSNPLAAEAQQEEEARAPKNEEDPSGEIEPTTKEGSTEDPVMKRKREDSAEKGDTPEEPSSKRIRLRSSSKETAEPQPTTPDAGKDEDASKNEAETAPGASSDTEEVELHAKEDVKAAVESKTDKSQGNSKQKSIDERQLRVQQMAQDYVELSSKMMLMPTTHLGPYGYDENDNKQHQANGGETAQRSYPLELISSLGFLKSPLRRPTIIEKWSPYEISLFEAGMGHYGKDFYRIHKLIQTKSTKEVIDFYYIWKKTSHYKVWKERYLAPGDILSEEDYGTTPVKKMK